MICLASELSSYFRTIKNIKKTSKTIKNNDQLKTCFETWMYKKNMLFNDHNQKGFFFDTAQDSNNRNKNINDIIYGPSWPEAMSHRSPRSITGREQNRLSLDLGIVPVFAEILNVLHKGSGEDSLDFLGFLTLLSTTSRL